MSDDIKLILKAVGSSLFNTPVKKITSFTENLTKNYGDDDYKKYLNKYGVKNPDNIQHYYDYKSAYKSNVIPIQWKDLSENDKREDMEQVIAGLRPPISPNTYMWPDEFKLKGHPIQKRKK